ncbi:hypothetical protein H2O64_22295 [Kordia sp. YSTF-M3]|uniref:Uncharacterized protein n=1 Tax=Kordia aestuariivivens TaxID=2759037 RepID=A0ABR7QFT0_9FLAO|nr:hypothetical protein [Kordia aestuariivivens]MBC8757417.1 hypothetical protein [Kordia aestuariivivens]
MKNYYLLFVGLLLSVTATQANEMSDQFDGSENGLTNRYRYAQPIQFVERGVEFFIFQNGEFDFNTHPITYSRTRRGSVNTTYGAPRVRTRGNRNNTRNIGVRVEHDYNGRVRRIGNLFINYDRLGRVKRIGSIYMRYHRRHGKVTQIGGLHLKYSRRGRLIRQIGNVKPIASCAFCGTTNCTINHGNVHIDDDFQNGHDLPANDDDLYYYRNNGKQKKIKKGN